MQSITTPNASRPPHTCLSPEAALHRSLMLNCREDWKACDSYPSYGDDGMDVCIFPGDPAERQVHFNYDATGYVMMLDLLDLTERADRMRTKRPGRIFRQLCRIERQHSRPELNVPVYWHGRWAVITGLILAACCFMAVSFARFLGLQLLPWVKSVLECCSYAVFAIVYFGLASCTVATWQEWRAWPTEVWSGIRLAYRARLAFTIGIACISVGISIHTLYYSGCLFLPQWVSETLMLFVLVLCIFVFIYSLVSMRAMKYNAREPLRLQERLLQSKHTFGDAHTTQCTFHHKE